MRVVHVITGLNVGGAETMLRKLLGHRERSWIERSVVSLTDIGPIGDELRAIGIPVRALGMRPGAPSPWVVPRLARLLRHEQPDVIQTWMYHADFIGGLAGRLVGDVPIAWNIRQSNLDRQGMKRTTLWTAKACARLSRRIPERIVCCGESAREVHAAFGYASDRMVVIPNGFDLDTFSPDSAARASVRRELGLSPDAVLIGRVARFDPQKDHASFIRAAALLHSCMPDIHFVLCGDGISWENSVLVDQIDTAGLRAHVHPLKRRSDVPRLQASFDVATSSSSYGEGFPNTIGEAMACGVPCVVTDVGDSARIVGDTGRVVSPRDPVALAAAWHELLQAEPAARARLGSAARERITARFSLPAIAAQYEALYDEMIGRKRSNHSTRRGSSHVWH